MIKTKLFKKHFFLTISTLVTFLVLGFIFNNLLIRSIASKEKREILPPIFFAKIIDKVNPNDKVKAISEFESWHDKEMRRPHLVLINSKGNVLYPQNFSYNFKWEDVEKPQNPYEYKVVKGNHNGNQEKPPFNPGSKPIFGPPPIHLEPPIFLENILIRLNDSKELYLLIGSEAGLMPLPPGFEHKMWFLPLIGVLSMIVSLLLGVGVAILIIYSSVNKQVKTADEVINELKKGNLKARFKISRNDEFGDAMVRFNSMADEIQILVERLKTSEKVRTKLLQELAHDLRTPIASLRNLLETLNFNNAKLDSNIKSELLSLSVKEVDFFERLVEDLLFLAQVAVPKYSANNASFNLLEILDEEIDSSSFKYEQLYKKVKVEKRYKNFQNVNCDDYLIKRLFRNVLDNAFSFAKNKIIVSINRNDDNKIIIAIEDDGSGFSEDALISFGERRLNRKINEFNRQDIKLSVGLGSVVMKEICKIYRGNIIAENIYSEIKNGMSKNLDECKVIGARVTLILNF